MSSTLFDFETNVNIDGSVYDGTLLELNQSMSEEEYGLEQDILLTTNALNRIRKFEESLSKSQELGLESEKEIKLFNIQVSEFCSEFGISIDSYAIESANSVDVGLEGIKSMLGKLKKAVVNKLKELGLRIKNYTESQTTLVATIQKAVKERFKKLDNAELNDSVSFSAGKYLTKDGDVMTGKDIVVGLNGLTEYHTVYGKAAGVNVTSMESLVKEMNNYMLKTLDRESVLGTMNEINNLVDKWVKDYVDTMKKYFTVGQTTVEPWVMTYWDNTAEGFKSDKITYYTPKEKPFNIDGPAMVVNSDVTKVASIKDPMDKVKKTPTFAFNHDELTTILDALNSMIDSYNRSISNNDLELMERRLETAYMRTASVNEHGFSFAKDDPTLNGILNRIYYTSNFTSFFVALAELRRVRIISNTLLTLVDRHIK